MKDRDENTQRTTEPALSTEDLARPAPAPIPDRDTGRETDRDTGTGTDPDTGLDTGRSAGLDTGREAAVYPGEATGDAHRPGSADDGMRSTEADAYRADEARAADADADTDADGYARHTGETEPLTGSDGADGGAPSPSGPPGGDAGSDEVAEPLLGAAEAERYRSTWSEIQGRFVDDPREAVRSADTLVAEVMQAFAGTLADHRGRLEKQWGSGEQVATEDLRQALRAYRSLINRLLDT
ncbi:hypothetical protein [Streptomyces sp. NPDC058701]|uniref:hypothetical protein n=1 Tax=Streptomyces sp. NPDC058701 TaxID=3346608 RepID=UPI0036616344